VYKANNLAVRAI